MQSSILFGFTAALCWGAADFCAQGSSRLRGTFLTLLAVQFVAVVAMVAIALPLGLIHLVGVPTGPALATAVVSLSMLGGYALLYRAYAIGKVALVLPIAAGFAAVTALLALLSGEQPSAEQFAGFVVTLGGVILASSVPSVSKSIENVGTASRAGVTAVRASAVRDPAIGRVHLEPGLIEALAAMLIFGVAYWGPRFVVGPLGGVEVAFIAKVTDLAVLGIIALVGILVAQARGKGQRLLDARSRPWYAPRRPPPMFWLFLVPTALFDTIANIAYTLGITGGLVSVVVVLSSLFSAVTVLLAWIFLRERLRGLQWLGVVVIFVGIALVST